MFRYVEDIGMFAFDRSIPASCIHATSFCRKNCYNDKLYKIYPAMRGKDVKNEEAWASATGESVRKELDRKRKATDRIRACTRGEVFTSFADVDRMAEIIEANPERVFWIPTRAWRSPILRVYIAQKIQRKHNVRLLASTDPTTTADEWAILKAEGWSTMFFGDNEMTETPNGDRMFKCPKTHKGLKGHCAICKAGCFNEKKRVDVHLNQH